MPASLDDLLPVHPRNGVRAVGFRRDGRPIWPIRGGSGEGGDPAPTGEQQTTDDGTEPNTPPPAPLAADPAAEQQLAEAAQRADEATVERDQLRAALDAVQQALNPGGTGEGEQDPAQLAAAVAERDQQIGDLAGQLRTARVELAAHQAAGESGARADRLLNSRSFLAAVSDLDPDEPKFGEQLAAAIKSAVDADPDLYRTAQAPPRAGAQFNGPPSAERRPATLHDAIAARLGG
ncbi:hypothetical protein [Streptomyces sp. NBC_00519]|uniref:hypothetical protein n=1 Tax=Streptomyces sp. NBC_00519 TaxID=2975764 RepID=UPI0030E33018